MSTGQMATKAHNRLTELSNLLNAKCLILTQSTSNGEKHSLFLISIPNSSTIPESGETCLMLLYIVIC